MKARFTTFKLFLMQHLFVVGLVLLFVVLSLCSCGRARAAEPYDGVSIDPYNINSLSDALDYMNISSSDKQTIIDAFERYCPYYQIYFDNDYHSLAAQGSDVAGQYITCPFVDSNPWRCSGLYYLAKADITPTYILQCKIQDSSVSLYFKTPGALGNYMTVFNSEFQSLYGSDQTFLQYYDNSGNTIISGDVSPRSTASTLYCYSIEGQHVLMQDNYSYVRPLGESPLSGFSESHKFFIRPQPSYVEDERLKLSTSLTGDGSKLLNIDLSAFRGSYTPAASYSFSDVVLHLDCDGTDVSYTINFSNSELVNSWNPSNNRYVYITPYSVFDLARYDDVYISGVDFSLTHSSPGGSDTENFKISAEYFLKHETAPIESDSIPLDNQVDADKLSVTEIQNINNDFTFSEGEYVTDLGDILPPDNFTFVEIGLSNLSVSDLVSDGIQISDYYYFITDTVTSVMSEERVIYKFLNDTSYPNTFDYILFDYIEKVDGVYDHYYFYYITVSGRIRMQNNILADLYFDVNQTVYNTSAIYDYLYNRLNDFEDKSLVSFNSIIGLDRQQIQWLSTLNNSLDSGFDFVVDAINNIDIPQPVVFDVSDILDKLDDLIDLVQGLIDGNEVDTPQECIQYYYDNQNGTIDLAFVPAYYEGMTLDFLYSIQGETQNNLRSGAKSGGGSATFVNDTLIIQIFQQFKDSFSQNYIPQNIRVFLSNITNDTGNHMYYFQLFHDDYDPEDFDGLAD